jgi:DNA repair protein RecN (Recombination protein N)
MLRFLHIRNFALVDELTVEFDRGLNVLTGETGAGKSIILDAIDALMGGTVTTRGIRTGSDRAVLEGTFLLSPSLMDNLEPWFQANEIDLTDELLCSREMNRSGNTLRSRLRINGTLLNRQLVSQLRPQLLEITGQGETTALTTSHQQRSLLDAYGGEGLQELLQVVADRFATRQEAQQALTQQQQQQHQQATRIELLQLQLQDLVAAQLEAPDELQQLEQECQTLSHVVDLQQQSYAVYQLLYQNEEGQAAADLLGRADRLLGNMAAVDPQLGAIAELVGDSLAQAIDASRQLNSYVDRLEADPERLELVTDRLQQLRQLCRKYNSDLPELVTRQQQLQEQLQQITGGAGAMENLRRAAQEAHRALVDCCQQLTAARRGVAQTLEQHLIAELQPLGMAKVKFQVAIEPQEPGELGADEVVFWFSPNPGEPPQPLAEIASGGEMSRFLLALKACFSSITGTGTLIFDEIDTGVSGKITQAIAQKLQRLAVHQQILCVTHQPMMAAMADVHFRVRKEGLGNLTQERTVVRIERLAAEHRRTEIAQLAGGVTGAESIAFADALISQAVATKQGEAKKPKTGRGRRSS